MTDKPVYVIDGANFDDFAGFIAECNRVFIHEFGGVWGGGLDQFNDFLWWGPHEPGYVLVWRNAEKSRRDLGHGAMVDWIADNMKRCHPDNIPIRAKELRDARLGRGPTVFDVLVEIITDNEHVELRLE